MEIESSKVRVLFSDFFGVPHETVEEYGAFDVSLVSDLPLFVDPFLLFNSKKLEYRALHDGIITYLRFLREKAADQRLDPGLLQAWYFFPEIKQNWLGFSVSGNCGRGLGRKFGLALHRNLGKIFHDFGREHISRSSHLEKLCLIARGVGKDSISDFTNNLIKDFLLSYTQRFARQYIDRSHRTSFSVEKVRFDYATETWTPDVFDLPRVGSDYVLLTPRDMLTKDDTWINKKDLIRDYHRIPDAIPNEQLRAQINNYFAKLLPSEPTKEDEESAAKSTILHFPELIDYYIRFKEDQGDRARTVANERVTYSRTLYLEQFRQLAELLSIETAFYQTGGVTYGEARQRVDFLKDVIENKGGHRLFYVKGKPIEREEDLQILYRLTWFASVSDVTREANDGRGPVDFKISMGSTDKTLVEFKLAKNSQLKRNLQRQAEIYEKASDADRTIKVIIFFSVEERKRVDRILSELGMVGHPDVVLIDARRDNKPSGSKAT